VCGPCGPPPPEEGGVRPRDNFEKERCLLIHVNINSITF
jgi:hypothetical protein